METANLIIKEQIVKTVVKSGNGGAVWVPKNWLGEEVIVILPKRSDLSIRERIIHLLEPYLKDIVCVAIYGSYARNEQTKNSDVDVLVLTNKTIKIGIKKDNLDITTFSLEKFKMAIEKYPIYYQIIQEAEALINSHVLEELKKIEFNKESFKEYLRETEEHVKSNKELVELDKLDSEYILSDSVTYSTILRLRGLFVIDCIINKESFSNKKFKQKLISLGLSKKEFEDSYYIYQNIRNNEKNKIKIKIITVEKLMKISDNEINLLKRRIHGKSQEKTSKRY